MKLQSKAYFLKKRPAKSKQKQNEMLTQTSEGKNLRGHSMTFSTACSGSAANCSRYFLVHSQSRELHTDITHKEAKSEEKQRKGWVILSMPPSAPNATTTKRSRNKRNKTKINLHTDSQDHTRARAHAHARTRTPAYTRTAELFAAAKSSPYGTYRMGSIDGRTI